MKPSVLALLLAGAVAGSAVAQVAPETPGTIPTSPGAKAPVELAACYQHRLPADAAGLDRVSMRLGELLRAREKPLVPVHLTDSFVTSLGICDRLGRTGGAAAAARCRIYQMCSRLDAMDPRTRFLGPGVTVTAAAEPSAAP